MGNRRYNVALRSLRSWRPSHGIESIAARPARSLAPLRLILPSSAALLVVSVAVFLSQSAKAVSLAELADALSDARAIKVSRYFVDADKPGEPYLTEWREGTKYRYQAGLDGRFPPTSQGFDGRRGWAVDFEEKSVSVGGDYMSRQERKLETVDDLVDQFRRSARDGATVTSKKAAGIETVVFEGKEKSNGQRFKCEITVNGGSRLPVEQRKYNWSTTGKWVLRGLVRFEYPNDIDDSVFSPQVPSGFVVYDFDQVLKSTLEAFKSGESRTSAGVTLTLLTALQESDGTVYVLWKGGAAPPLFASASVVDSRGVHHVAEFFHEADDRSRPRNYGVPPKNPKPPIPPEQRIVKLGPLGWHNGEPFYCLKFNPARFTPNVAQNYKVVLPACVKSDPYFQQPERWLRHQNFGREVGQVEFEVRTTPVSQWWWVYGQLDPDRMFLYGSYPATNIGMTRDEVTKYKKDQFVRTEREMMEHRTVNVFGG